MVEIKKKGMEGGGGSTDRLRRGELCKELSHAASNWYHLLCQKEHEEYTQRASHVSVM